MPDETTSVDRQRRRCIILDHRNQAKEMQGYQDAEQGRGRNVQAKARE